MIKNGMCTPSKQLFYVKYLAYTLNLNIAIDISSYPVLSYCGILFFSYTLG